MDPRLQLRVQRYGWDAAAPFYDAGWREVLKPAQDMLLDRLAAAPGERVLETACGTGLVTLRLAEALGQGGAVLATDLSQAMVDETARRADAAGLTWVRTLRQAADDPVPDRGLDAAACALGLMYAPDPARAVAAMALALRPAGRLVATVWGARAACGWAEIFPIVDAEVRSEVCPMFFAPGTGDALARDFLAAGLSNIETRRQGVPLRFGDADSLLSAMLDGGPVAMAVKRFDDETRRHVGARFLESVAGFRTSRGAYEVPGEFVTVSGTRAPTS